MLDNQKHTRVLLHLVEGPVNLGAVCRAMANTGFGSLRFTGELSQDEGQARKFALHARPILDHAKKYEELEAMVADHHVVFGFTPRNPWEDGRGLSMDGFLVEYGKARAANQSVGLLFGNEARGLQNEHLVHCHWRVSLPTHSDYASMNLAQAVLVVLWELARARQGGLGKLAQEQPELIGPEEKRQLLANIQSFLETIEFLNPQNPDHLWAEIFAMFNNRDWTQRELTLLHAMFGKGRSRYLASLRKLERRLSPDQDEEQV